MLPFFLPPTHHLKKAGYSVAHTLLCAGVNAAGISDSAPRGDDQPPPSVGRAAEFTAQAECLQRLKVDSLESDI